MIRDPVRDPVLDPIRNQIRFDPVRSRFCRCRKLKVILGRFRTFKKSLKVILGNFRWFKSF